MALCPLTIFRKSPNYAIKLRRAWQKDKDDFSQDWYLALHLACEDIKADLAKGKKLNPTESLVKVMAYRSLNNRYRDESQRHRLDPVGFVAKTSGMKRDHKEIGSLLCALESHSCHNDLESFRLLASLKAKKTNINTQTEDIRQ